ncbi:hypothetical protein CLU79DRAFT_744757 [Phycomyces nitens]|nr:hypothetical protein CLU79DRAFT_744757 [Phycomyces nitens]
MDSYIDRVKSRIITNSGAPPFVLANDYPNTYRPSSSFSASSVRTQSSSVSFRPSYTSTPRPPPGFVPGYNRPPSILHQHKPPTHLLGPILGAFAGLIVLAGFVLCLVRRRRPFSRTQKVLHTFQETNESKTRQGWGTTMTHSWSTLGSSSSAFSACPPPPVYTPKDTRRLTADTLVDLPPFRHNSLSSKNQYTPQLAFSPSAMGDRFSSESLLHVAPAWSSFMISARSTEHPVNHPNQTFQR